VLVYFVQAEFGLTRLQEPLKMVMIDRSNGRSNGSVSVQPVIMLVQ
jgi:hypothetical protein